MTQGNAAATGLPARLLIGPIRSYQKWLSPALPARCRFLPTCSEYAVEALRRRGVLVGSALALWRLVRCQPFHPGGYDPVPRPQPVRRPHRKHDASVQWATPPSGVIR